MTPIATDQLFALGSLAGWLLVVLTALRLRGRAYATYGGAAGATGGAPTSLSRPSRKATADS
jgi:hypothetical protein